MTASPVAIEFSGVSKIYRVYSHPARRLWDVLRGSYQPERDFHALNRVSFTVAKGEVLGLVGKNGAGKSTLLQLACATLSPSEGRVQSHGRIAALLELGAGFSPELTGRENIYLNAPLFGLSSHEVAALEDQIIEFADIGRFVDLPVRTYSSGMFVRLAFSLATSVQPDILVIDEALSVGDGSFARRSFDRIMQLKERGATVLFCSHSTIQIEALCDRALWIRDGRLEMDGPASEVVMRYNAFLDSDSRTAPPAPTIHPLSNDGSHHNGSSLSPIQGESPSGPAHSATADAPAPLLGAEEETARLDKVEIWIDDQAPSRKLKAVSGQSNLHFRFKVSTGPHTAVPNIAVLIADSNGKIITSVGTWVDGFEISLGELDERGWRPSLVELSFPQLDLLKGVYSISAYLVCDRALYTYTLGHDLASLEVSQSTIEQGVVRLKHAWVQSNDSNNPAA